MTGPAPLHAAPPARRLAWRLDLLARGRCSTVEALVAAGFLLLVGVAVYGSYVVRGGFILDDWKVEADYELLSRTHGFFGTIGEMLDPTGRHEPNFQGRPVGAVYHAIVSAALGTRPAPHLALALALGVLTATLLFVLLRNVGFERIHAAALGALVLLFPAADSARLWAGLAVEASTLSLCLLGAIVALAGLGRSGPRAVAFHACAVALYVTGVLLYEIAAPAILLSFLLYRLRAPWSRALPRGAADAVATLLALAYLRSQTTRPIPPLAEQLDHAERIFSEARRLLASIGIQNGTPRLPLFAVALVLLSALVVHRLLPRGEPLRGDLRRWLTTALAGVLVAGAGYALFVPADPWFSPLTEGIGGRTNIAASPGYVLLLYSLPALLGLLLFRGLPYGRALAAGFTLAVAVYLGAAWLDRLRTDQSSYRAASETANDALDVLRETVGKPPPGTTIYLFGVPRESAPNVPIFTASWDLTGAVRLLWRDYSLRGVPGSSVAHNFPGNEDEWGIDCGPRSLRPRGYLYGPEHASPYGKAVFVDVPMRRVEVIRTKAACESAAERYLGERSA